MADEAAGAVVADTPSGAKAERSAEGRPGTGSANGGIGGLLTERPSQTCLGNGGQLLERRGPVERVRVA